MSSAPTALSTRLIKCQDYCKMHLHHGFMIYKFTIGNFTYKYIAITLFNHIWPMQWTMDLINIQITKQFSITL